MTDDNDTDDEYRVEEDSMGEVRVPEDALYGAQTQRAVENFPVSDLRFGRRFIHAIGVVKLSAAKANNELGLLDDEKRKAIVKAAREVAEGEHDDEFPVDIFQTGSGTSTNMNANEVISNRASEIVGAEKGSKEIHPNDHVNMGQSSNDVIPTSIHVAALTAVEKDLLSALRNLHVELDKKAEEFDDIVKTGRTHLQDATPVRLGQEFSGYAAQVEKGIERVEKSRDSLRELAIGGTAVGTGLNTHPDFPEKVVENVSNETDVEFVEASNHFEAQAGRDAVVEASGALKTVAASLMKIANDLRWLSSGPRTGFGEIDLPAVQPGSSIMPGKINPVIPESVCQVVAQVTGNDTAINVGGQAGNFELNVMKPVMAHNLLESIELVANVSDLLADRCVADIEVNRETCEDNAERSLSIVTALAPHVGYDDAAEIAKQAMKEGRTIREVAREHGLSDDELDDYLDVRRMTERGILD
ncbi:MAG: class II fumarate hydratase [Halobacteriales archaeon]|nr:class II fumarate hydratase [Halobacteriales archaeon]